MGQNILNSVEFIMQKNDHMFNSKGKSMQHILKDYKDKDIYCVRQSLKSLFDRNTL
jgi:hypothetical protein